MVAALPALPPAVPPAVPVGAARRAPARQVVQLAYAVRDLEAAAREWAQRVGAGPFHVRDHGPLTGQDAEGRDVVLDHSSAYGQWGDLQVELLQVHATTSSALRPGPGPGLHHVTWFVDDLAAEQQALSARGWPAALTARSPGGSAFALHDARRQLGHLVEVYEPSDRLRALYDRVARASQGWDGGDPVRAL